MTSDKLKPGDIVEVRSGAEILATLDDTGALAGVPFMPEMLQFVGRRFTVAKRVEKICDMIAGGGSRRMRDTVFLEDLRCDGSAHGGCQAECRVYWKEEWLVSVDSSTPLAPEPSRAVFVPLAELSRRNVRPASPPDGSDYYRCQATEAVLATEPLKVSQPGQYVRELRSRNVTVRRFVRVAARAIWGSIGHRMGFLPPLPIKLGGKDKIRGESLGLKPGDWVQVKSAEEIGLTLDQNGKHRGMPFTAEMIPSCGKTFQVRSRVTQIVEEKSGKMLHFKNDCIVLEGNVCTGDYSPGRWFCPRDGYPFWREDWLRRIEPPASAVTKPSS